MNIIELVPYVEDMEEMLEYYRLKDGQELFVLHPKEAIDICKYEKERRPFVLQARGEIVGFLVLHSGGGVRSFSEYEHAVLVRAFSIDAREQGKGYAKKAISQLPSLVATHFPMANEIVLAVNQKNEPARSLYESVNFKYTGRCIEGRSGLQDVMHFPLTK
ncbi:GNAT family N-acetyltransferase [Halalkalibacter flavus]|uniref:GNAT family N-acetyltransferase n=1 Tax=Halalkalibacter flavus TaxID=3090668 RepID=UPI002FCC2D2B